MSRLTLFSDPAAVDAWDAWFRWREAGALRDLTIDDTWARVAAAIAAAEQAGAAAWSQRFAAAFSAWELLPDEHLLRSAGAAGGVPALGADVAVLNVAAFVRALPRGGACFERERFRRAAALAVRLLDDALLAAGMPPGALAIGVIGLADAFAALGLRYDSEPARRQAGDIAAVLAEGTLQASVALAIERGACDADRAALAEGWRRRGMPRELVADALRRGVRHPRLTTIRSQPRLALLANNVADALDPMIDAGVSRRIPPVNGGGPATAGVAGAWIRATGRADPVVAGEDVLSRVPAAAQVDMRAAVQPWVDAPIDYPLAALSEPDDDSRAACADYLRRRGLAVAAWRVVGEFARA